VSLVTAILIGAAVWLLMPRPVDPRLVRLLAAGSVPEATRGSPPWAGWLAASVAALGAWMLVGGVLGGGLAVIGLAGMPPLVRRLEPRWVRERRERVTRQAPLLCDLLAATLASGATVRDALEAASQAVGEPTSSALSPIVGAVDLGADPIDSWRESGPAESHRPIVDALARAQESGAPAAVVLARVAQDLRREHRRSVEVAARAAGVRAVAPLAACFLPAFLLIGVVPVVVSLATGLWGG